MTKGKEWKILIEARIKAQNFDSANKKVDDLEKKLEKWGASWQRIRLTSDE